MNKIKHFPILPIIFSYLLAASAVGRPSLHSFAASSAALSAAACRRTAVAHSEAAGFSVAVAARCSGQSRVDAMPCHPESHCCY